MKRKKLKLNKETLRTLDSTRLGEVAGAAVVGWSNLLGCSAKTNCLAGCQQTNKTCDTCIECPTQTGG
jgi:hypothetical protein